MTVKLNSEVSVLAYEPAKASLAQSIMDGIGARVDEKLRKMEDWNRHRLMDGHIAADINQKAYMSGRM